MVVRQSEYLLFVYPDGREAVPRSVLPHSTALSHLAKQKAGISSKAGISFISCDSLPGKGKVSRRQLSRWSILTRGRSGAFSADQLLESVKVSHNHAIKLDLLMIVCLGPCIPGSARIPDCV